MNTLDLEKEVFESSNMKDLKQTEHNAAYTI